MGDRGSVGLIDEEGIQYNYLDMTEMPHKTMTYLRMYCIRMYCISTKHESFIFELRRRDLNTF